MEGGVCSGSGERVSGYNSYSLYKRSRVHRDWVGGGAGFRIVTFQLHEIHDGKSSVVFVPNKAKRSLVSSVKLYF